MHTVARLLLKKYTAPALLAGTLALAAGGAAALNPDGGHAGHHGCRFATAQVAQHMQGTSFVVSCWAGSGRDGDGRWSEAARFAPVVARCRARFGCRGVASDHSRGLLLCCLVSRQRPRSAQGDASIP